MYVAGILALALVVRLVGLDFGLPNSHHVYPYNPDEWTPFLHFKRMQPERLDFNPHSFINPTSFYYLLAAGFVAAEKVGWVRISREERFHFEHPEYLHRMILLGRLFAVAFGVATVWLLYRLARHMGLDRGGSRLAALLLAIHPSHVAHSHFMTVNTAVTFWIVAAFLALERWLRRGDLASRVMLGIATGIALSTKYTAILLVPVIVLGALIRARIRRKPAARDDGRRSSPVRAVWEGGMVLAVALLAFVAGTPYALLAFPEFKADLLGQFGGLYMPGATVEPWSQILGRALPRILEIHLFASTPLLLAAAVAGAVLVLLQRSAPYALVLAFLAGFFVMSLRAGGLATDGRFLPVFPLIALLAAVALTALASRHPRVSRLAIAVVVVVQLGWTFVLLGRYVGRMPQEEASQWAQTHVRPGERVLLAGSAVNWNPDLPLREYLHSRNAHNYERVTDWVFVAPDSFTLPYREARALDPDVVFLTEWLPFAPVSMEWLEDPDYQVVATFPGKVHVLGRRVHVRLDLYDVDTWVLRPRP
ncbi:MAG TPA: glycosyltransferase family 39 protein [Candidatus Limnocylindria bacterium]|nr:glycosyltransferase family 39 protein [Candidatus Limnocylindria bacterium]